MDTNKYNKGKGALFAKPLSILSILCSLLFGVAFSACSDLDDYNSAPEEGVLSASQTLWENIQQHPQLTHFADLVRRTGFDEALNQTHYYTVWAPLDGTYDASAFQSLDSEALMRQFVQNHIASYAHSASGAMDATKNRILMLNEKQYYFGGNSEYTFAEVPLHDANLPNSNGLLHTLDGLSVFYPNLYEFITDSALNASLGIDSLRRFYQSSETTYLDTERSVVGSIVNGMQTYADSVMVTENSLWDSMNAMINSEDSTYSFLLPTNNAWNKAYERISSYYNYLPNIVAVNYETKENGKEVSVSYPIDSEVWRDSIASSYLTRNLIFNNNDSYNRWLVGTPSSYGSDTLRTTLYTKLSNPLDILAQASQTIRMSNGRGYVVDSLAFLPWETFAPMRRYSATSSRNLANVKSGSAETVDVITPDPEKVDMNLLALENDNKLSYLLVTPSGAYSKPELTFYLPNVLSTTYSIYCVFVPKEAELGGIPGDTVATLPSRVVFTINYCDTDGKTKSKEFNDDSDENKAWFDEYYEACRVLALENDPRARFIPAPDAKTKVSFSNDPSRVDTIYVGDFTFPVSYAGLGSGRDMICPYLRIASTFNPTNAALKTGFTNELRVAAIILKPKELVEYEEELNK